MQWDENIRQKLRQEEGPPFFDVTAHAAGLSSTEARSDTLHVVHGVRFIRLNINPFDSFLL